MEYIGNAPETSGAEEESKHESKETANFKMFQSKACIMLEEEIILRFASRKRVCKSQAITGFDQWKGLELSKVEKTLERIGHLRQAP